MNHRVALLATFFLLLLAGAGSPGGSPAAAHTATAAGTSDITTYAQACDRLLAQVVGNRTDVQEILGAGTLIRGPLELLAGTQALRLGRGPGWVFVVRLSAEARPPYLLAFVHQDATVDVRGVKTLPAGLAVSPLPAASCNTMAAMAVTSIATQEAAYARLLAGLLGHSAQGRRIHVARNKVGQDVTVATWRSQVRLSGGPGWLFFVDDAPTANWEHPCRFVLVGEDGGIEVAYSRTPPADMGAFTELTVWPPTSSQNTLKTLTPMTTAAPDTASALPTPPTPAANRHAVIISGGYNQYSNYPRYWNDCAFFFKTLKQYGFLDANIHVLFADGTDPAVDRSDGKNSPLDFNGDGVADIKYSATKANLATVFNSLASRLGANDILYIFSTDHGGEAEGNDYPYNTPDVVLYLWNEFITGDELAAEVNKVNAKAVVGIFEQCFSGGIVEKLKKSNRVLMSASRWWELSYAMGPNYDYDEFSYHATTALTNPDKGDTNGDRHVTMEEAYLYALSKDSWQSEALESDLSNAGEHPSYWSSPWDLGRRISLGGMLSSPPAPRLAGYVQTPTAEVFPAMGTARNWKADDKYWSVTLPFSFPMGGTRYKTAYVSSNGILYFKNPSTSGTNTVDGLANATALAPLWDDLTTDCSGCDIYIAASYRQVTVSWVAAAYVDKTPVKMAVRLYPNGRVTFHYGSGNAHIGRHPGRDKTIGISLKDQDKGMHLGLHNGLSRLGSAQTLQFSPVGLQSTPWLSPLLMQ